MKEVRSFSLDEIVAKKVDEIPRNERSRKINQILRGALLGEKKEEISLDDIKKLISTMNVENNPPKKEDNEKVKNALSGIIGMKK